MPRSTRRVEKTTHKPKPISRAVRTNHPGRSARPMVVAIFIIIAIFAIGVLIVQAVSDASPWQYSEEISPKDALSMINRGAVILDVRTYEEFVGGHIEKSLFMPLEDLSSLMQALPRNRLIITVCRTGVRSIQARYILQEAGFTQVTSLKGGMEAWTAANYPVVYGEPVRNN